MAGICGDNLFEQMVLRSADDRLKQVLRFQLKTSVAASFECVEKLAAERGSTKEALEMGQACKRSDNYKQLAAGEWAAIQNSIRCFTAPLFSQEYFRTVLYLFSCMFCGGLHFKIPYGLHTDSLMLIGPTCRPIFQAQFCGQR